MARTLEEEARMIGARLVTEQGLRDLLAGNADAQVRLGLLIEVNVSLYELEKTLPWRLRRQVRKIRKPIARHLFDERGLARRGG